MKCQVDSCLALSIMSQSMTLEPGMTRSTCYHCYQVGKGMHISPLRITITVWSDGNSTALGIVLFSKRLSLPPKLNISSLRSWHKETKRPLGYQLPGDSGLIRIEFRSVWNKLKESKRMIGNEALHELCFFFCISMNMNMNGSIDAFPPTPLIPVTFFVKCLRLESHHKL